MDKKNKLLCLIQRAGCVYYCVVVCVSGVRCWHVDLDVSVLDQQLKLFVSRHSAFLSEHVPGENTHSTVYRQTLCVCVCVCVCVFLIRWTRSPEVAVVVEAAG